MTGGRENIMPATLVASIRADFCEEPTMISLRDCLRSKSLPHPKVKALLSCRDSVSSDFFSEITTAHTYFLQQVLPLFTSKEREANTSLLYMSHLATISRFLQVMLELSSNAAAVEQAASLDKMAASLWQLVSSALTEWLKKTQQRDDCESMFTEDLSSSFDTFVVALYWFGSLVKLNPYARSRFALTAPLWKSIGELLQSFPAKGSPAEVVEPAVRVLLKDYVTVGIDELHRIAAKCGESAGALIPPKTPAKLVSFFLVRLGWALRAGNWTSSVENPLLDQAWSILVSATGIGAVVQALSPPGTRGNEAAFLECYWSVSQKSNATMISLVSEEDRNASRRTCLRRLVQATRTASADSATPILDYIRELSFYLGKAEVLQQLLSQNVSKKELGHDLEGLLLAVESLVSQCLSSCLPYFLLSGKTSAKSNEEELFFKSFAAINLLLWRLQSYCSYVDPSKHRQVNRWIVQHLSSNHPVTRGFFLEVIFLDIVRANSSSDSLLALVLRLVWHVKTSSDLRQALSTILTRAMTYPGVPQVVKERIREATLQNLAWYCLSQKKSFGNKRRRSPDKRLLSPDDWRIVCPLVAQCRVHQSRISKEMEVAVSETINCIGNTPTHDTASQGSLSLPWHKIAVFLHLFSTDDSWEKWIGNNDPSSFFDALIQSVLQWISLQETREDEIRSVLSSVVRLSARLCGSDRRSRGTGHSCCRLVSHCLGLKSTSPVPLNGDILIEICGVLQMMGPAVDDGSLSSSLEDLKGAFLSYLTSRHWPVVCEGLSMIVRFGETVRTSHGHMFCQSILQPHLKGRLSSRVKRTDWKEQERQTKNRCIHLVELDAAIRPIMGQIDLGEALPSGTRECSLPPGSFFVKMNTLEGRSAWAVFPPGSQSVEDINYMCGGVTDGVAPEILTVKRATIGENGEARMFLSK